MLTLDNVYRASYALKGVIRKTDIIRAPKLNREADIYLKTENLQITGSFKIRGSYYKMTTLFSRVVILLLKVFKFLFSNYLNTKRFCLFQLTSCLFASK